MKKGQLLLEFDMEFIRKKGLSLVTPVVIANSDDFAHVECCSGDVKKGETLITVKRG